MKRKMTAGTTSVALPLFIQDTSSTTGGGLSGLVFNTAGLVAEYRKRGQSSWTTITLVTKTLGTWTSGGFVADGSLAGSYELDLPDAAISSGSRWVVVRLYGAANMLPVLIEIELDAFDYQTSTVLLGNGAHGGSAATLTFERLTGASNTPNEPAFKMTGNGSAAGMQNIGGVTGPGQHNLGGSTSGEGILNEARAGNSNGDSAKGFGSGAGTRSQGGATGNAYSFIGGATSGAGIAISTQSNTDCIIANTGAGILAMIFGTNSITADALSSGAVNEIIDAIEFPPAVVLPTLGSIGERVKASKITVYVDETLLVPITVLDANEDPIDLSGLELVFTVKDDRRQVVLTIEDDDIAISGDDNNVASVTLPDDVSEKVGRKLDWSIRNVSGNVVLGFGEIEILYAP
jgi:hypothetical protein